MAVFCIWLFRALASRVPLCSALLPHDEALEYTRKGTAQGLHLKGPCSAPSIHSSATSADESVAMPQQKSQSYAQIVDCVVPFDWIPEQFPYKHVQVPHHVWETVSGRHPAG